MVFIKIGVYLLFTIIAGLQQFKLFKICPEIFFILFVFCIGFLITSSIKNSNKILKLNNEIKKLKEKQNEY